MKKILIFIGSDLYVRNFIHSGAFQRLEEEYQVLYALPKSEAGFSKTAVGDQVGRNLPVAGYFQYTAQRSISLYWLTELSMAKLRHKSSTFNIKYKLQLGRKKRLIFRFLTLPGIYELYVKAYMRSVGVCADIDRLIAEHKPDLVVVPTSLIDSVSTDVVICARRHRTKSLMLINGWDNVSSKGTIPYLPDYLGLWGEQSFRHAVDMHAVDPATISKLGAPHFEAYRWKPTISENDFRRANGLPADKRLLLFAGCARVFDETSVLLELDQAIADGRLQNVHLLYRPHPWRHRRLAESSFFDHKFTNVTIDKQLAEAYRKTKEDSSFINSPNTVLPDLGYYANLYGYIAGVIHPLTSISVEAASVGVPSLAIAFNDGMHDLTADKLVESEHVKGICSLPGMQVCYERDKLIDDSRRLLELSANAGIRTELMQAIQTIVVTEPGTYAGRLGDFVDEVIFPDTANPERKRAMRDAG